VKNCCNWIAESNSELQTRELRVGTT